MVSTSLMDLTSLDLDMYYSSFLMLTTLHQLEKLMLPISSPPTLLIRKADIEYEIVAFASDPINITSIISGDGSTPGTIITVTTATDHGLTTGTPIKINGVDVLDYNIFKGPERNECNHIYLPLPFVRDNLPASPGSSVATVVRRILYPGISLYLQYLSPFCLRHERYARRWFKSIFSAPSLLLSSLQFHCKKTTEHLLSITKRRDYMKALLPL